MPEKDDPLDDMNTDMNARAETDRHISIDKVQRFQPLIPAGLISIGLFLLSLALRVPATSESYWIDELHTAWAVSGDFSEVSPRAAAGHQQAIYFQTLWLWSRIWGDREIAMRATSVIAVSLSCSLLFLCVAKWHHRWLSGLAAGIVLAVETNSIFFGTELRPYAMVILASTAACGCYAYLFLQSSKLGRCSGTWVGLFACIGIAAVCQVTSIAVLGWLPIFLIAKWIAEDQRGALWITRADLGVVLIMALVGLSLYGGETFSAWQSRSMWSSFASATSLSQLWTIWPWQWLVVWPLAFLLFAFLFDQLSSRLLLPYRDFSLAKLAVAKLAVAKLAKSFGMPLRPLPLCKSRDNNGEASLPNPNRILLILSLLLIVLVSTFSIWCVAYFEIAALWHRRYLVAALPILGWCFGALIGESCERLFRCTLPSQLASGLVMVGLVAMLMGDQGTILRVSRGIWPVSRGEDWRGAIEFINHIERGNESEKMTLCLDPGLIEQQSSTRAWQQLERGEYLRYAVDGPYSLEQPFRIRVGGRRLVDALKIDQHPPKIILTRRPKGSLETILRIDQESMRADHATYRVHRFGNVSVAVRLAPAQEQ